MKPRLIELRLSGPALVELMRAVLARGAAFRFRARGISMHPFIRHDDVVTVAPALHHEFRPGDVVAFTQEGPDRLVIHRVISIRGQALLVQGDNVAEADGLVPSARVLGRVIRVERAGRSLRLGLGPERRVIAWLNRIGLLRALSIPARKIYRWFVPRLSSL